MAIVVDMIREASDALALQNTLFPNPCGTALRRQHLLMAEIQSLQKLVADTVARQF
jgi:hypothetical protein